MKIILLLFLFISVYADIKQQMFNLYQNKKYEEACYIGYKHFANNINDEKYVSLYAFSCLYSDYIDRLATPIITLRFSKEARANSAYFSVLLLQKKLLHHSLIDGNDISGLNLPTTDYVLSKVFDLYSKLGKHEKKSVYIFEDKDDKKLKYKLYLMKGTSVDKMVIEELYNSTLIKKHIYW